MTHTEPEPLTQNCLKGYSMPYGAMHINWREGQLLAEWAVAGGWKAIALSITSSVYSIIVIIIASNCLYLNPKILLFFFCFEFSSPSQVAAGSEQVTGWCLAACQLNHST